VQAPQHGGLRDRTGRLQVVFDVDPTVKAIRQRAVVDGSERPQARRRAARLAAPGYTGRKRGEVVRSRMTVQQAHTHEWLGTFGTVGSGERWARLGRAAEHVCAYLHAHGLAPSQGVVRTDGEFGSVQGVSVLVHRALGYLLRCADYRLLDRPEVAAALARAPQRFVQTDTGTVREVYDVGWVRWAEAAEAGTELWTRLVVTCTAAPLDGDLKIGKRVEGRAYELFVTDRGPEALTASDVLSLYFARGGFEQTLSEEDRELATDRVVSGNPYGQEAWQILTQWVWNLRLQLGWRATPCAPRVTRWAEAVVSGVERDVIDAVALDAAAPEAASSTQETALEAPSSAVEPNASVDLSTLAAQAPDPSRAGFTPQPEGTLRCPEGKVLKRVGLRGVRIRSVRFQARASDCRSCARAATCLGPKATGAWGRRVNWPLARQVPAPRRGTKAPGPPPRPSPPPVPRPPVRPVGAQPVDWYDLPATALRRGFTTRLLQQHVEGLPREVPPSAPRARPQLDREHRAHRRLRWDERLARNARWPESPALCLNLHGVPTALATELGVRPMA
jgi:hypothetical protein